MYQTGYFVRVLVWVVYIESGCPKSNESLIINWNSTKLNAKLGGITAGRRDVLYLKQLIA